MEINNDKIKLFKSINNVYWDEQNILKLPNLKVNTQNVINEKLDIGKKDLNNKIVYKEHYLRFKNEEGKTHMDMYPMPFERTNIQLKVLKDGEEISINLPSIGLSKNGEGGFDNLLQECEDYKLRVRLNISHPKGKWSLILETDLRNFKNSNYSRKYNGKQTDNTNNMRQKNMVDDFQRFVPIRDFIELDVVPQEGDIVDIDWHLRRQKSVKQFVPSSKKSSQQTLL